MKLFPEDSGREIDSALQTDALDVHLPEFSTLVSREIRSAVREAVQEALRRPQLLPIADVAEMLSISVRTVENLIAEGRIRPVRVRRGCRRFETGQIEAFIRECACGRGGKR